MKSHKNKLYYTVYKIKIKEQEQFKQVIVEIYQQQFKKDTHKYTKYKYRHEKFIKE